MRCLVCRRDAWKVGGSQELARTVVPSCVEPSLLSPPYPGPINETWALISVPTASLSSRRSWWLTISDANTALSTDPTLNEPASRQGADDKQGSCGHGRIRDEQAAEGGEPQ